MSNNHNYFTASCLAWAHVETMYNLVVPSPVIELLVWGSPLDVLAFKTLKKAIIIFKFKNRNKEKSICHSRKSDSICIHSLEGNFSVSHMSMDSSIVFKYICLTLGCELNFVLLFW